MDNKTVHEILLKHTNWDREMMPWEHCGKTFYNIGYDYVLRNIKYKSVMRCFYNDEVYYFNIGTTEPEITESMLRHGNWEVYTWSD